MQTASSFIFAAGDVPRGGDPVPEAELRREGHLLCQGSPLRGLRRGLCDNLINLHVDSFLGWSCEIDFTVQHVQIFFSMSGTVIFYFF